MEMFNIRKDNDNISNDLGYIGRLVFSGGAFYHGSVYISTYADWGRCCCPRKIKYHIIRNYKRVGQVSIRGFLENDD